MKLIDLLDRLDYELYAGELDREISTLTYDSRKVEKDSVFVCISGTVRDAHDFIPNVIEKGASVIIIEKDVCGFYVKMTDVGTMEDRQGVEHLPCVVCCLPFGEFASVCVECALREVVHHEIGCATLLEYVCHADNARMVQLVHSHCFVEEAVAQVVE